MLIKTVSSCDVPATSKDEGREFISLDSFLDLFEADHDTRIVFSSVHKRFLGDKVEKRVEEALVAGLERFCLWGPQFSENIPIVTNDGWVFWIKHHQLWVMREALAALYSQGQSDDLDFVHEHGLVWHVHYLERRTIVCAGTFQPSVADKKIFERFQVERISQF